MFFGVCVCLKMGMPATWQFQYGRWWGLIIKCWGNRGMQLQPVSSAKGKSSFHYMPRFWYSKHIETAKEYPVTNQRHNFTDNYFGRLPTRLNLWEATRQIAIFMLQVLANLSKWQCIDVCIHLCIYSHVYIYMCVCENMQYYVSHVFLSWFLDSFFMSPWSMNPKASPVAWSNDSLLGDFLISLK